jgi:hypothetical protein
MTMSSLTPAQLQQLLEKREEAGVTAPVTAWPGRLGDTRLCRVQLVAARPSDRGDAPHCRVRRVSPWRIMPGGPR